MTRPILLAGPTASGKSALALALAQRLGGAVVNADSQQVYDGWRILTARPTPDEELRAPHFLYGHIPLDAEYSAGVWLRDVAVVLRECAARSLVPIITGGTGLYFKALTEGLAPIPLIPPAIRAGAEADLERLGLVRFAVALAERDPETAATLDRANPARLLRAWEVLAATGTGLAEWRRRTAPPQLPLDGVHALALTPTRDWLYARCEARFDAMLAEGVLDEARHVRKLGLDPALPAMKAVGAPELMAHLRGERTLAEAATGVKTATRRYAKRQLTWVRNQMFHWHRLSSHNAAENLAIATEIIANAG
jgi:tRNA dimethylallyltransferase